jgi:AcrR family transcriptional regulator
MKKHNSTTKRQFEIIQAAGKILINSGMSGLTTKKLAQEMGFSESALYRHFNSKHDIIAAMLNYLADNMQQRFDEVVDKSQTPIENFKALFNSQFEFFSQNPYFVIAVLSDGLMQESVVINQAIKTLMATKSRCLQAIIKQAQEQNQFTSAITADQCAHIIMGSFRLLMLKWRMDNFKFNLVKQGQKSFAVMLTLLQKS